MKMTQSKMTPKPVLAGWKFSSRTALCTRVCIKMHLQILSPSLMPGSIRLMARVSLSQHSSYFKRGCKKKKKKALSGWISQRGGSLRVPGARGFTPEQAGQHLHQAFHAHTCINHSTELCAATALQKFPALRVRVGYS